jgi:1-acyl-sn-glycerol-3-phosphate acyltransferase
MLPRPRLGRSRVMARSVLWHAVCRARLDKLPRDTSCVLVANHASYLDGIMLLAAAQAVLFVAKRELKENMVTRLYLQRIGAEFVERFGFEQSVADVKRLLHILRCGQSLAFFPEGTFYRMPGLLPFRMGAFVIAAQAGIPVVPVVIRGSRSILRSGQWLPRRGAVSITISAPIAPQGNDWPAAIQLRNAARVEILHSCGEPDLPSP